MITDKIKSQIEDLAKLTRDASYEIAKASSEQKNDVLRKIISGIDKSRDRKAGGTGLGLAIVKHIAFVHGGEVKVSFSQNKKTRFTIILPLVS